MSIRVFLALAAALVATAAVPAAAVAHEHTLKIATLSPENSDWMRRMREGAETIAQRTDGRVEVRFYGGGVMGDDQKVMRKMRIGQLHGATFTAGGLVDRYPDAHLYGLPLLFNSLEEVDYVRERMDEHIEAGLAGTGLVTFGLAEGGFARLMSNTPVRNLEDLRGHKVWVPEGDVTSYAAMKAMGLAPVTLPVTDVLTGLQTGLIDIIGSSPQAAIVLQWHTKVKYVTDFPLTYVYATLAIEERYFERLDAADRATVREVMEQIYDEFDAQNRVDNRKAAEALRASGIEFVEVDEGQVPRWRTITERVNEDLAADGAFSGELLAELKGHLADFRQAGRQAAAVGDAP